MTYALDRFSSKEKQKSLVELIQDTSRTTIVFTKLVDLIQRKREQQAADTRAHRAMKIVIDKLSEREAPEEDSSTVAKWIKKLVIGAAKSVLKAVVRPIVRFAVRVAMNIVRFALNAVVETVIVPVMEAGVALVLANPVTAAIAATLVVAGGGYWVWKKFFKDTAAPPTIPTLSKPAEVELPPLAELEQPFQKQATAPSVPQEKPSAISQFTDWILGTTSHKYESGKRGAATISSGAGDYGGVSYGTYQLSSNQGSVSAFLTSSGYDKYFEGLTVGTPEFNAKWIELAKDPKFGQAQTDYTKSTYYDVQARKLQKSGVDLSSRGSGVQDMIWSTAVQFGGKTGLILKALEGLDITKMTDGDIIKAVQAYKRDNVDTLFKRSSPKVRAGIRTRIDSEERDLLALSSKSDTNIASNGLQYAPGVAVDKPTLPKTAIGSTGSSSQASVSSPDREVIQGKGKTLIGVS